MTGLGTIVNVLAILVGGAVGCVLNTKLPRRVADSVMQGLGLAVLVLGLMGAIGAAFVVADDKLYAGHVLLMIVSLAAGALAGELIGIEEKLEGFAKVCERRFAKPGESSSFARGFVTATVLFCTGSMAIVGAMEDGLAGNRDILFSKAAMDGITSMIFASTLGAGVLFSAVAVGAYQGAITLLAVYAKPFVSEALVTQLSLVGSVLIAGIGLNLLGIAKIRTGNLLPALLVPVVYHAGRAFFS